MRRFPKHARFAAGLFLALFLPAFAGPRAEGEFSFARENVLGTSFDLSVIAPSKEDAERCELSILKTAERLAGILSTYEADTEIRRINELPPREGQKVRISADLAGVLKESLRWREKSGGAFDAYMGDLVALWGHAARENRVPPDDLVRELAGREGPGFAVEQAGKSFTLRCESSGQFVLDAIAKGYILDRAVEAARKEVPSVRGILLDIGGDFRAFGTSSAERDAPWEVAVADPQNSADNGPPIARVRLRDEAVATSGGYGRPLVIGGKKFSHIIDPRTGRPADAVLSATVVAPTGTSADALATILCVLEPAEGLKLVAGMKGVSCLIVDRAGKRHRSPGWGGVEVAAAKPKPAPAAEEEWPRGYKVGVVFRLNDSTQGRTRRGRGKGGKFHRHFTAVWVEDRNGRLVKVLALWAQSGELKYVKNLDSFWEKWTSEKWTRSTRSVEPITRATRPPGRYSLVWDGTDEEGRPVARGRYSIHIDINREKGPPNGAERHTHSFGEIDCGSGKDRVEISDKPELQDVVVTYGP